MGLFRRTGHGGGIIKGKLLLSVLLLFGLALILNVNTSSATNVTADTSNQIHPEVTAVNPASNSIILKSKPIKVTFSETVNAGSNVVELKNGKSLIPIKKSIKGNLLTITSKTPLKTGVKYKLILHANSVIDQTGNGNSEYLSTFTVSPINLKQMKDGLSRTQKFYNSHNRLPKYVNFGKKKIGMKTFEKIIATQGLKIVFHKASVKNKSNAGTVTAHGWNSCSKGWFKTGGTFLNYCPICHKNKCLIYNPKHTYEGEWTCADCDSDFCLCGKCKACRSSVSLIKA